MADGVIREGFLCPICMQDLGSVQYLQKHFEQEHSQTDKDSLNLLKGLFSKAKAKLSGRVEPRSLSPPSSPDSSSVSSQTAEVYFEPQTIGAVRASTEEFKAIRQRHIHRYVIETNKLITRLEKLLDKSAPLELSKRKAFERAIVVWANDEHVPLCPGCGKSFRLMRRRHHCRLCGGIMCHECSVFLPIDYGHQLVAGAVTDIAPQLRRSSSISSMTSMAPGTDGDQPIRICHDCRSVLARRHQLIRDRNEKPDIIIHFEKLHDCCEQAESIYPELLKMVESLNEGDVTYDLRSAQTMRDRLARLYEQIDLYSKKIIAIPCEDETKTARLHRKIRQYANQFVQERLIGLQALPTVEQYEKLREVKRQREEKRIIDEKRTMTKMMTSMPPVPAMTSSGSLGSMTNASHDAQQQQRAAMPSSGWQPDAKPVVSKESDPLLQQMDILQGYIRQAKLAKRWDEVQMLEKNYGDIQREIQQRKHEENRMNWND